MTIIFDNSRMKYTTSNAESDENVLQILDSFVYYYYYYYYYHNASVR